MRVLRDEMDRFYRQVRRDPDARWADDVVRVRDSIVEAMGRHLEAEPESSACQLKARLHEEIAERFEPVLFPHSPFFFEMGLRPAENWGTPDPRSPSCWLLEQRRHRYIETDAFRNLVHFGNTRSPLCIDRHESVFDADHHCLGYTKLLRVGVNGLLAEIADRLQQDTTPEERDFLDAAGRSCRAVIRVAERFANKAEMLLPDAPDAEAKRFLTMIAEAARHVPAEPPRTFYEGLAAIWFLREVAGTLEGVGVSVVGHIDRLLIDLYRNDLEAGRLTVQEARDLLARWMLPTDMKFFIEEQEWPETSTCIELGGCDADGDVVFNELTRLIVEVHAEHNLLNPKLNCRYSSESPPEYLDLLSTHVLAGHNVFALLNDDVLIPACMAAGKTEREARLYVNGGCQETVVEGVEHSAGAYYYFGLPRVLDLCLQPAPDVPAEAYSAEAAKEVPQVMTSARDFEDYYTGVMDAVKRTITAGAAWRRDAGRCWRDLHPCPFISATLDGCVENGLDYTAGGARYNPAGIALVGFGTLVDSLHAIRKAIFEDGWCTLPRLQEALAANWDGHEALRARFVAVDKYGHGCDQVDRLAARVAAELAALVRTLRNERDGPFQPSFFVYYAFVSVGQIVRATPDGRHDGEWLSQGVAPGRLRAPESLTDVLSSLGHIDFRDYPGNAVLDLQLPAGGRIPVPTLSAVLRTFARLGGATLQPNCVSVDDLRDAQQHPEAHEGLSVRISGLSARFVTLTRQVQDEIIQRECFQA